MATRRSPAPPERAAKPSLRPLPWSRFRAAAVTLADFKEGSDALDQAYPLARDARTMAGFSALKLALPRTWREALQLAFDARPSATPDTTVRDILERGTERTLPGRSPRAGPHEDLVAARRSALGRLHDALPGASLREVDGPWYRRAVEDYRRQHARSSSHIVSSDLTELHVTINAGLTAAGLPMIGKRARGPRPTTRVGAAAVRRPATLDEVDRVLIKAPLWLRALIALMLVAPVPYGRLLALRADNLDFIDHRLRASTPTIRGSTRGQGSMVYGLTVWCEEFLRSACPGIDAWSPDRLVFSTGGGGGRARRNVPKAFRRAADAAGCPDLTLAGIRLLAQSLQPHACRAVRRGTSTAKVTERAEADAGWLVAHWRLLHSPPSPPRRVPRRAANGLRPGDPETRRRSWEDPPDLPLPASARTRPPAASAVARGPAAVLTGKSLRKPSAPVPAARRPTAPAAEPVEEPVFDCYPGTPGQFGHQMPEAAADRLRAPLARPVPSVRAAARRASEYAASVEEDVAAFHRERLAHQRDAMAMARGVQGLPPDTDPEDEVEDEDVQDDGGDDALEGAASPDMSGPPAAVAASPPRRRRELSTGQAVLLGGAVAAGLGGIVLAVDYARSHPDVTRRARAAVAAAAQMAADAMLAASGSGIIDVGPAVKPTAGGRSRR